jgi:hypothetical protein
MMSTTKLEADLWERIVHPEGPMSRATAERILTLSLPADEKARMHELAERNRAGKLSPDEAEALDNYCRVGNLLSLLKSRARQLLKPRRRVS